MRGRRIDGKRLYLEGLTTQQVNDAYVRWMNDSAVTRYLESRYTTHYLADLVRYVANIEESRDDVMFGIHLLDRSHIGNVKIGEIDHRHHFAEVGLIIGEASARGLGYGTEVIELATRYAFEVLDLNKVTAGTYASNEGAHRAFLSAGWRDVGRLERHRMCDGEYVDQFIFEKVRAEPAKSGS